MDTKQKTKRKIREGVVVSNKMDKTVTVRVQRIVKHPQFEKAITQSKRYYAHNEKFKVEVGQKVRIVETRPVSKLKRWKVIETIG